MKLGLLLLIGLPGSGKTTLAKTLKDNFELSNENEYFFIHICYDELITFPTKNSEFEWKKARNLVATKIENLLVAIKIKKYELCPEEFIKNIKCLKPLKSNIVLILDDNMYFKSMRYSLYQVAKRQNVGFCQVFLNCSLERALLNNSLRESNSAVPPCIIQNMYEKLEPPNVQNFWERYSVLLDVFCEKNKLFDKLLPVLNESLINPEQVKDDYKEHKEISLLQCKTSVLHQADVALRNIVGLKIKEYHNQKLKKESEKYYKEINIRKSEILNDIKMGNIFLPEEILGKISQNTLEKCELIKFLNGFFQ